MFTVREGRRRGRELRASLPLESLVKEKHRELVRRQAEKSRQRTSEQLRDKLMAVDEHASLRFTERPPTTRHGAVPTIEEVQQRFAHYCTSLRGDAAYLLTQFRLVDFVLRAVGVGRWAPGATSSCWRVPPVRRCSCR